MSIRSLPVQLQEEIEDLGLQLTRGKIAILQIHRVLLDQIKEAHTMDEKLAEIIYKVQKGKREDYNIAPDGTLQVNGRICVSNKEDFKQQLLEEAHQTPYYVHPSATKMY